MSIKISNFVPLNTPAGNDILPIIDVSEPNTADQNKKITVDNLLSLVTGQENPYIQVKYGGDILPEAPIGSIAIGEDFNKYAEIPFVNRIPDSNSIYIGSGIHARSPDFGEIYGEFPSWASVLIGNDHFIGNDSRESTILGYGCGISNAGWGSIIIGSNSFLGEYPTNVFSGNTLENPSGNYYYNIMLGDSVKIVGNNCTSIGYVSKIYNNSANSIAIGTGARIGDTSATTPSDSAIALGDNAKSREDYSISVGYNSISSARYGVAIGAYSEIEAGATNSFCFGGYISSTAEESISIGLYSYTNGPASIAIGPRASANPTTARAIAIGDGSAARASYSIVMGGNNSVINTSLSTISIGDESGILGNSSGAIVLGSNNNINTNSSNSICIGKDATINTNCVNAIALGAQSAISDNGTNNIVIGAGANTNSNCSNSIAIGYLAEIVGNANNCIQLGIGSNGISNSLRFLDIAIANDTSIQISTQTTNVAPTSTPADGTLILDQTGNGKLWVRVNGTWKSTTLS